ncbi:MAG: efflux RND transporter periplasmic adaptor subunit [Phyllobacteriaceae bacterium]|nr:efflux RND transporter periplasmic adaptor subunit [Phyllobacteriaceae bacterium]
MAWWKQAIALLVLLAAAATSWARFDAGAASRLESLGLPKALVRVVAGERQDAAGGEKPAAKAGKGGGAPQDILVVASKVASGTINDRASAIGNGEARHSVVVAPLVSGFLAEVAVGSGDTVKAGDALARLDSRAETIARDRAALALKTTEDKLARIEALQKARTATAVQLGDARDERDAALFALRDAELKLDQRIIRAPIDGIVGIVSTSAGNAVTPQTEIATIDDRSSIVVEFWIPERFAGQVAPRQPILAKALAQPGDAFSGVIDAVASRVERDSRTLRVRAVVDNSADRLRPGMAFEVTLKFPGVAYPAVDPLAVQWSSDGAFVWRIADGKAERVAVRVIQRNSDYLLVEGAIAPGDSVVVEGVQSLRPGVAVRLAGAQPAGT